MNQGATIKSRLVGFYLARGHNEEEAQSMAESHLKGRTVIANAAPESTSPASVQDGTPSE